MAWTQRLESGGEAQGQPTGWWDGNGASVQFDPSNPGRTAVSRANGEELYTEYLPWDASQAKEAIAEAAYAGLANGNRAQALQAVQAIMAENPQYWASVGITDPGGIVDYTQQSRWRRLTNQDDDKFADIANNLAFLPHVMGAASLFSGGNLFGGSGTTGGGMDWWGTDYMGDFGFPEANVNTMMPAAVPESATQLTEWGLKQTAPGVWELPAMPDIKMGATDWLKLGSQALSGLGGLGGAAPNVNTMGGLGSLFGGNNSTLGMLGGGALGALLGGLGESKKIGDATTTTSGFNSTLSPAAEAEMLKTIRGDYLNPDSNPWLKSTFDRSAGEIQSKLSPSFGHMEAFGQNSGFQNAYGRSLADLGTSLYGGNYNNERQRQFGAASSAPNYTQSQTTPIYANKMGGMFSGALAGGLLGGKLFGG